MVKIKLETYPRAWHKSGTQFMLFLPLYLVTSCATVKCKTDGSPNIKTQNDHDSDQDELHSRSGEGHGSPLQCSCLENPRDGRAWRAALYGVAQSRTRLKRLNSDSSSIPDHHTRIKAVRISPQSTCCVICLHFITVALAIPEL